LGSDKNRSFDSRYFGPVPTQNVIGRLVPLWTE
ncbi:MAG: S26 family signal peptidase, partial [Mesorhizobium sp.]